MNNILKKRFLSGLDSSGIIYTILDYSNSDISFLSQFNSLYPNQYRIELKEDKNEEFENKKDSYLNYNFNQYNSFENKCKFSWDEKYHYFYSNSYSTYLRMDYFDESSLLYIAIDKMSSGYNLMFNSDSFSSGFYETN